MRECCSWDDEICREWARFECKKLWLFGPNPKEDEVIPQMEEFWEENKEHLQKVGKYSYKGNYK